MATDSLTDLRARLEHTYAAAVPELSTAWRAAPVEEPELLALDEDLAVELDLDPEWLATPEGLRVLTGNLPEEVPTYAQGYAGHQFGGYSPQLGDGRALLVGEILDSAGARRDLHLKGSGRTPFARGGDGLAAVGPMLREYLMGQAMHALGIPTTRSLAVVATGRPVMRERPLPGAILTRVASSHLRVGTVQFAAAHRDRDLLRRLANHAIDRHHPHARDADDPYLGLFAAVVAAQAELVAAWMGVGLIHGVMNTDNTTLSGETIDYGPCAMLDAHDPAAVFSSIDHGGRYAYGNQPAILSWNLARLGEALLPLIGHPADDADPTEPGEGAVEAASEVLQGFAPAYERALMAVMSRKIGFDDPLTGDDAALVRDLFALMAQHHPDHTRFFRGLAEGDVAPDVWETSEPEKYRAWLRRREEVLASRGIDTADAEALMQQVNPVYVPRNHVVEDVLDAATAGDLEPFGRILDALTTPFDRKPGHEPLEAPAPPGSAAHVTYCGT
ncbi:MAG: YdiU family protein [Mobilicoccus sp.]|nr:YdiU family protein [Mobilicoccus sp.]